MPIILSAPAKSGFRREYESIEDARKQAAELLSGLRHEDGELVNRIVTVDDMIEVDSPDGGTTYCYTTQDEADADRDGAYAVQYTEVAA